uniref:Uncharacterized protein n=1 Tax=Romanomermis culicivorax TaxID=13658 RepID=A0A915I333_ROMCU
MQKCNAIMINFRGDATNMLSKMVTLVIQQQKLLEEFKTEIEEMKAHKRELSKPNIPEIENIVRPTSSYAQSLNKWNLPKMEDFGRKLCGQKLLLLPASLLLALLVTFATLEPTMRVLSSSAALEQE